MTGFEALKSKLKAFNYEDFPTNPAEPWIKLITNNGEITYNYAEKEFTVWDETYNDTVGKTNYPLVAYEMLRVYAEEYLEG